MRKRAPVGGKQPKSTADKLKESLGIKDNHLKNEYYDEQGNVYKINEEATELKIIEVQTTVNLENPTDADMDYVYARNLTYTLAKMTGDVLQSAYNIAVNTEDVLAHKSFNQLANTLKDLASELMTMHTKFERIENKTKPDIEKTEEGGVNSNGQQTTKMSTSDLVKLISSQEKEEKSKEEVKEDSNG